MKNNSAKSYTDRLQPFFESVGSLSKVQRIAIVIATFSILTSAFVFFSYMPKLKEIKATNEKYENVKNQLSTAKIKAAQLGNLQKQWDKKQEEFKLVMAALPDKKEIPTLLSEISKAGKSAGLDFHMFAPQTEISRDFYAEIPVTIQLQGSFISIAEFFDNISQLSRIVNIKNINMKPVEDHAGAYSLSCSAITYRFLSDEKKAGTTEKK